MRLKKEQVQKLAELVLKSLQESQTTVLRQSEPVVVSKINELMTSELMLEVKLDADVRRLMEQYKSEIASGKMDANKVFQMIKKQLVQQRGIVL